MGIRASIGLGAWLLGASVCGAAPFVSEFMADNTRTLRDKDNNYSDWIEICNPDSVAVNMAGWYLTDDRDNLRMWAFPAVSIPARSNLVVFASGKDIALPGSELHTNFQLKRGGEYLALVRPDGFTIASEYDFPQQYEDVSYGLARQVQDVPLLDLGFPCRVRIPTNSAEGTAWRAAGYNDSTWTTGRLAVGFFTNASPDYTADLGLNVRTNMYPLWSSAYLRAPFVVADTGQVQGLILRMRFDDGFSFFINGQAVISSNAAAAGSLTYTNVATAEHHPGVVETYDIFTSARWLVPGTNVAAVHGLNRSISNNDAFFMPQLLVTLPAADSPQTGYFAQPTPRLMNGGNATLSLPQVPTYSVPSGVFTNAFTLTMGGADAGLQIRYTVDGSIPTTNSLLYSTPVNITTSRHIRARIFAANGQCGPLATAQYTFLDPNVRAFESNLPLLILRNVDPLFPGAVVTQTIDIQCYAQFIEPASNGVTRLADAPALNSRCGVNVRGSSSAGFAKKPYALELWSEANNDCDQPVLGMAPESDWTMIGCYTYDRTYIYNALAFELGRQLGAWEPTGRWVEVFFSTNAVINVASNQYVGLYYLCEKLKISGNRIDLARVQPWETGLPDCTGGYMIKVDRAPTSDEDEFGWVTSRSMPTGSSLVLSDPFKSSLATQQITYVTNYVQQFENVLYGADYADPYIGYAAWIKPSTWIEHHWLNNLSKNPDMLRLSAYMHKDRSGRICAGPEWDYDRCFSSYDARSTVPNEWYSGTNPWTYSWWARLFADPAFRQRYGDRWQELRRGPFSMTNMVAIIDRFASTVGTNAATRDYIRWNMWPSAAHGSNYPGEIAYLKTWLSNRVAWIDAQYAPSPTVSPASAEVSPGFTFTLSSPTGTVYYTLDGSDPLQADGTLNPSAFVYLGPVPVSATARVRARTLLSGTNWSSAATASYLVDESFAQTGDLAIVEIHYHPLDATTTERAAVPDVVRRRFEFLEIQNVGARRVNLDGVTLPSGQPADPVALAPLTLDPGGRALVVADLRAFWTRYGTNLNPVIAGEWSDGELADGGETVTLLGRDGTPIQSFRYNNSGDWPGRPDGKGSSLEYAGTDYTPAGMTNPENWRASTEIHGSPGAAGVGPYHPVTINEVLTHTDLPYVDAIELYCSQPGDFNIGGWFLSDQASPENVDSYAQYRIPDGTYMPAYGPTTFDETDFNPNGYWNPNPGTPGEGEFALDAAHGDEVWLIRGDEAGRPAWFVDHVEFPGSVNGVAYGSWPDGSPDWYRLSAQTLVDASSGTVPKSKYPMPNAAPAVGPMLISEVHHHPTQAGGTAPPFIELRNAGPTNENLGHWTLRGTADFDFPTNLVVAPGGFVVVVPFSPTNAADLAAFRTAYALTGDVSFAGPWEAGDTLTPTGRVVLYRADEPPAEDPTLWPQTWEESVSYSNLPPWPAASDGGGFSLTRRGTNGVSRLAQSWMAEVPSPGSAGPGFEAWRALYLPGGGGVADDDDHDGYFNAYEYAAGTRPDVPDAAGLIRQGFTGAGATAAWWYEYRCTTLDRPDERCAVQSSSNLVHWTNAGDTAVSNATDWSIRRAGGLLSTNGPSLFLRFRVGPP